jgi:ABC-type transporter Mla subunit MlaD
VINEITAIDTDQGPVAVLGLKLDKTAEPLRADTQVTVRPRSTLGLKYLEIEPGSRGRPVPPDGRLALKQAQPVVDLDEVVNTFDEATRRNLQRVTDTVGPGLTGRGMAFNSVLADLPELVTYAERVMANLADPQTRLSGLIRGLELTASAVAPVSPQLSSMIDSANTTFAALQGVKTELGEVIAEAPETELAATNTLVKARPLLADATALLRDIRPGSELLPTATRRIDRAIDTGLPVLHRALGLSGDLKATLGSVEDLSREPLTTSTLQKLDATLISAKPTVDYIVPMQTVCNYLGLWTRNASSAVSEGDANGNWFRTSIIAGLTQFTSSAAPAADAHVTVYPNTGQNGECEAGNEGWDNGVQIGNPAGNQGGSTEETRPPGEDGIRR